MTTPGLREIDPATLSDTNPFVELVEGQKIVELPRLTLESGITISNVPIAYKTWGNLNEAADNVLLICHTLTGSADVSDWWDRLLGPGLALDYSKFLIICLNALGSPYGSFSPLTINPDTGIMYGPEFPLCTVRDDITAHRMVLDSLGVKKIACVIGGSMGGMMVLEWLAMSKPDYVSSAVALATSAQTSAWCISWSEAQRQSIYSDPKYAGGYYSLDDPPVYGLSAARMSALLTYRSRDSFEVKFSRNTPSPFHQKKANQVEISETVHLNDQNRAIHNDGLGTDSTVPRCASSRASAEELGPNANSQTSISSVRSSSPLSEQSIKPPRTYFSAQTYLRYQGTRFVKRFDANCYISMTRKLDTHDLARDRPEYNGDIHKVLQSIEQPTLIIGIGSDGLFTYSEQEFLSRNIPRSRLEKIESLEGHDAFLLEFQLVDELIVTFLSQISQNIVTNSESWQAPTSTPKKSIFEEEEITNW